MKSKNEWIQAGFYLITEAVPRPKDQQFLPPRIITVSDCMAKVYPGVWALTWVKTPTEELARIREELQLTESEFAGLRSWVDRALNSSEFGWPNLFLNLSSARDFNRQFMRAVRGVRLIGLSIKVGDAEEFMRLESEWYEKYMSGHDIGENGLRQLVSRRLSPEDAGVFLGFDVIGIEVKGDFHTFSCCQLVKDYVEKLGITFNAHGLIPDEDMAFAAAKFTNCTDAEGELWCEVKLYEFEL